MAIVLLPQPHPFGMKLINQCFLCSFVPWCFGFPALGKKNKSSSRGRAGDKDSAVGTGITHVPGSPRSAGPRSGGLVLGAGTAAWHRAAALVPWSQPGSCHREASPGLSEVSQGA